MASISIDIPNAKLARTLDAFCVAKGYKDQVEDPDPKNFGKFISNPESKSAFAKRMVAEWVLAQAKAGEVNAAIAAAKATAEAGTSTLEVA